MNEFYTRVFTDFSTKYKKYKKLFNNLLIAVIVEALVILAMIIID